MTLGQRFLHARRQEGGGWRDFRTLAGESTEWVSAVALYGLVESGCTSAWLRDECRLLRSRQRANGGWGYRPGVPSDADSTAWSVLALTAQDGQAPHVAMACDYLARHQDVASGGIRTYAEEDAIDLFMGRPAPGWTAPHACVTASSLNAMLAGGLGAHAPEAARSLAYLEATCSGDGLWDAYWWTSRCFATWLALAAFARAGRAVPGSRAREATVLASQAREGCWPLPASRSPGSCFETSCAVLALACAGQASPGVAEGVGAGVRWLCTAQRADGAWEDGPVLRIPPPQSECPGTVPRWREGGLGGASLVRAQQAVFTTALALLALAKAEGVA